VNGQKTNSLNQKAQIINEINFHKTARKSVTFSHIRSVFEVNFCFPVSLTGIYISVDLTDFSIISLNHIRNQAYFLSLLRVFLLACSVEFFLMIPPLYFLS